MIISFSDLPSRNIYNLIGVPSLPQVMQQFMFIIMHRNKPKLAALTRI